MNPEDNDVWTDTSNETQILRIAIIYAWFDLKSGDNIQTTFNTLDRLHELSGRDLRDIIHALEIVSQGERPDIMQQLWQLYEQWINE